MVLRLQIFEAKRGGRSREERRVQACRGWTLPGSTFATLMSKWRLWSVCTMSAPSPALSGASSSSRTALSLQTLNPSRSKSGSRTDGVMLAAQSLPSFLPSVFHCPPPMSQLLSHLPSLPSPFISTHAFCRTSCFPCNCSE